MRRLSFVLVSAALVFLATLPGFGQRGGGGGGFASGAHAGGFGGGFHAPAFSGSFAGSRTSIAPSRTFSGEQAGRYPQSLNRPSVSASYPGSEHRGSEHRRPYRPYPGRGFVPPYGYGYGTYLAPNFVGYPFGFDDSDDFDDDASSSQPQVAPQQEVAPQGEPYGGEYAEPGQGEVAENQPAVDEYRPLYQGSVPEQPVSAQPATTLIFNDGRPNEQVYNYVLTSSTLYYLDGGVQRAIPLSEINVPATAAANRSAGVDFAPPPG